MPAAPLATVVMPTHNRREDVARAVRSALAQVPPVDVVVVDDGSTDGTAEALRAEFPAIHVERHETSAGPIVRRNECARLARTPFIVSIDDDAEIADPHTVARTLENFDHPRVGAVAVPFINVNDGGVLLQHAPVNKNRPERIHVTQTYIGAACAFRRDLFLSLGGYREFIHYQFEEQDFCTRMLEAGFVVRLGTAPPVLHYHSPQRIPAKIIFYGERGQVLLAFMDSPEPVRQIAGVLWRGVRKHARTGALVPAMHGLARGLIDSVKLRAHRRPLRWKTYRLLRSLVGAKRSFTPEELDALFPAR